MALRLSKALGRSAESWLVMQDHYREAFRLSLIANLLAHAGDFPADAHQGTHSSTSVG
jgi:hypothetical protein